MLANPLRGLCRRPLGSIVFSPLRMCDDSHVPRWRHHAEVRARLEPQGIALALLALPDALVLPFFEPAPIGPALMGGYQRLPDHPCLANALETLANAGYSPQVPPVPEVAHPNQTLRARRLW